MLMYIYSTPSNTLQQTLRISHAELEERQGISLRLDPGNYRFVCWGNVGEGSSVDTTEGTITSTEYAAGETPSGIEELYFGDLDLSVPLTLKPIEETIIFAASYIKMSVELLNFANLSDAAIGTTSATQLAAVDDATVSLYHANHSALIDFTNTPSEETTDYAPVLSEHPDSESSYIAEYLVPRFDMETTATIDIRRRTDSGEEDFYSRSLSELMDELGITVDDRNEQEVNLRFRLVQGATGVSVEVVGWDEEIVYPEL